MLSGKRKPAAAQTAQAYQQPAQPTPPQRAEHNAVGARQCRQKSKLQRKHRSDTTAAQ